MSRQQLGKPVIGLMGGIGSGKSLVARQLASLGCAVIDADALARDVLEESDVKATLQQWWGSEVIDAQGRIDRRRVASIVFGKPDELARLEQLVHPRVHTRRHELRRKHAADPAVVAIVEDSPLLLEAGLDRECDRTIFIVASCQTRLQRLAATRGWSQQDLAQREKNQFPLDIKAQRADYVVDNNAGEAECLLHVRRVLSQILQNYRC